MFTDLANFTASVGRSDRASLRNLIAHHEQTVAPVIERHGGRVVKNLGDSYMTVFPCSTDAVRAGLELVERISGQEGLNFRAGVATGDVEEIDGDAFGEAVNLAKRVESKTPAGEVWFDEATRLCMNQAEIAWEPVGRFPLKGIAGESEICRAVPVARCWLPEAVKQAARGQRLVRIRAGDPLPPLPARPLILLEGFESGSRELSDVVDSLPVVDPASLWLSAYNIAPSDRWIWIQAGRGLVIGRAPAVEVAVNETRRPVSNTTGSDTIIIDVSAQAVLELVMAGLALPSVPLSEVVAGYTYDLLADGRWVNRSDRAVARVDVSPTAVTFVPLMQGLMVGGRSAQPGDRVELRDGDRISAPCGPIEFHAIGAPPYAGLLYADSISRLGIAPGGQAEIGREPNHPGLALPDRRGQANIRWCGGSRAARARDSGFTLDRALAGRRQGAVCLGPTGASVVSLHERCATYIRRDGKLEKVGAPLPVVPGDLIVTGTSVIAVREPAV